MCDFAFRPYWAPLYWGDDEHVDSLYARKVRQFFATDPRPPSERDFLWSFVIFVVGMTFLAGAQVVLYPGQGKEGFDLKAVLDGLLVGQNYLAVLLVCCLVMLIYRRGYLRGLEHGRAAERVRRQELRSAVRPLR